MTDNPSFIAVSKQSNVAERLTADVAALTDGRAGMDTLIRDVMEPNADLETRWRATIVLGKLGDVRAVDVLMSIVDDEAWEMRHSAIWSLCALGDERGFGTLCSVCSSGKLDEQINYVAAIGLARQFGERGAAVLNANLSHTDENVRAWARAALANLLYAS
jgi:HEAT repeat protein